MAITMDQIIAAANAVFGDEATMLSAFGKMMVFHQQFPDNQQAGFALALLDARMGVETAQGVMRIAQGQAEQANQQAQAAIQAAQADMLAAQARFDVLVASLAGTI